MEIKPPRLFLFPEDVDSDISVLYYRMPLGSYDEDVNGVCHLFEHLIFKFIKNRDVFLDKLSEVIPYFNAWTSTSETVLTFNFLSKDLEKVLALLFYILKNVTPKDSDFDLEKDVIFQELKSLESSESYHAQTLFSEYFFKGTPYEHQIGGLAKEIRKRSMKDFYNHFSKINRVDHQLFILSKPDIEHTLSKLDVDYIVGETAYKFDPKSLIDFKRIPSYHKMENGFSRSWFYVLTDLVDMIPVFRDFEFAFLVLVEALNKISSPLYKMFRQESGLAYNINSVYSLTNNFLYFMFYADIEKGKDEEAAEKLEQFFKEFILTDSIYMSGMNSVLYSFLKTRSDPQANFQENMNRLTSGLMPLDEMISKIPSKDAVLDCYEIIKKRERKYLIID